MDELTAIIERARAGDTAVFGQIVARFQDMAVGYCYALLGDFHLAQDAAQEAFVEAYQQLGRLRECAAFAVWFRSILHKRCDRIRRSRKGSLVSLECAADIPDAHNDPELALQRQEAQQALRAALQSLPETERIVVTLFYFGQHSYLEIAQFVETPVSTVKSRLFTARRRLKETLNETLKETKKEPRKKRMVAMVEETLKGQRPSRDDRFASAVIDLLRAAGRGDGEHVRALLESDTKLNTPHDDPEQGHTHVSALHYAAEAGHIEVARMLLDAGAEIDVREESHGQTPLNWAAVTPRQQREMAEFLLARGAAIDLWSAAALGRSKDVARLLAADPSQVNARLSRSDNAMTPLHLAAWRNQPDVVRLLLHHGADRTARTASGQTALEIAEREGHTEVVALLRR